MESVARELGLDVIGQLAGGEHGAWEVARANGQRLVLKVFPLAEKARLAPAVDIATRLRDRGIPVPDPYATGVCQSNAYTLQQRCEGNVPRPLLATHAQQLLDFWQHHVDAAPEGRDWVAAVFRALTIGDASLWAEHEPVRAAGDAAAALLEEIIRIGATGDPRALRETDAVHGDWHHQNLLVIDDRVTTIFDWESARAGDARYDLVYLNFWASVYEGSTASPTAAEGIRRAVADRVDPEARRLLAALVGVHNLWFTAAHRPERIREMVDQIEQHLAPAWRE